MTAVRSILFQTLFYSWTAMLALAYLPLLALPRGAIVKMGRCWSHSVLWLLARTVGLTWRVEGAETLPRGRFIVAAKHQSAWDTLVMPVLFPDPVVILKKELLLLPFYGWYAKKHGMIGVDRGDGANALRGMVADAARAAARGQTLVMFPEGTRTAPGDRRPYQRGIAALYARLNLPVVPVALDSGLYWRRRNLLLRPGVITVRILPPIPPGLSSADFMTRLETDIERATDDLIGKSCAEHPAHPVGEIHPQAGDKR
jgi:1-acyl-sn-glycerol-3-phosphate acyltransferase